jgi:peroxiredoxin
MGLMVASNSLTWVASFAARYLPNAEALVQQDAGAGNAPATADGGAPAQTANASYEPAPEVELKTLAGEPLRLSDYRGRVVLLNFWATWCVPCRSEIPALGELNRDLQSRGFAVVGLSTNDTSDLVKEFQKEIKMDYTVALGDEGVAAKYKVGVLPTTFVIDREGRIRHTIIGEKTRAYFEARIAPLLDETTTAATARGVN